MATNESTRFEVRNRISESLGPEFANLLMDIIPPYDWTHIATKDDLAPLATRLELVELRAEMNNRFAQVDAQFAQVDTKLADLRTEIHQTARSTMATTITVMIALHATTVASVAGLFQLMK